MFKHFTLKDFGIEVTIAALYVVLVVAFYFMSFQAIQLRIAEILLVLVLFNKKHTIGIVFGTFIANWIGEFGIVDAFFGSFASLIVCLLLILLKKFWHIMLILIPALINSLIISIEISLFGDLWHVYFINAGWIFLGEALVMLILGIPFKIVLEKTHLREKLNLVG